jgi:predicted AlkP superfamily phosphohydrolase/phosphomutase
VGEYPLGLEAHDVGLDPIAPDRIGPGLVEGTKARVDAALWLLHDRPCDVFLLVFGETHAATHYCWPGEGQYSDSRQLGDLVHGGPSGLDWLRKVYREIDAGIGRLLVDLPADTTVCLFSPDSARSRHGGWHLLPEALRRLGYLFEPAPSEHERVPGGGGVVRTVRDLLPKGFRKSLARRLPTPIRDRLAQRVDSAFIDWGKTRAFCLPTDLEGCIRINLSGREPLGIVAPEDYAATCGALADALSSFVDPATGGPVVKDVVVVRDVFEGARMGHLPDLVVIWEDALQVGEMRSAEAGLIAGPSPDGRPGTHGAAGFVLAAGPRADEIWGGVKDVRDIALAALRTFGVDAPPHLLRGELTGRDG